MIIPEHIPSKCIITFVHAKNKSYACHYILAFIRVFWMGTWIVECGFFPKLLLYPTCYPHPLSLRLSLSIFALVQSLCVCRFLSISFCLPLARWVYRSHFLSISFVPQCFPSYHSISFCLHYHHGIFSATLYCQCMQPIDVCHIMQVNLFFRGAC